MSPVGGSAGGGMNAELIFSDPCFRSSPFPKETLPDRDAPSPNA